MDVLEQAIRVEEYKSLREEIAALAQESKSNRQYAVTGTALVYSWLSANLGNAVSDFVWLIPLFFPILGFARYLGIRDRISDAADYLRQFEGRYFEEHGWEGYLHEKRNSELPSGVKALDRGGVSTVAFWVVLFILDLVVIGFAIL